MKSHEKLRYGSSPCYGADTVPVTENSQRKQRCYGCSDFSLKTYPARETRHRKGVSYAVFSHIDMYIRNKRNIVTSIIEQGLICYPFCYRNNLRRNTTAVPF